MTAWGRPVRFWAIFSLFFVLALTTRNNSQAQSYFSKPSILVYSGKGICHGCATAVQDAFQSLGFDSSRVTEAHLNHELLSKFSVFVIPGGVAYEVLKALSENQKKAIRNFVLEGGTYLGICAGAFAALDRDDDVTGLNLSPGTRGFSDGFDIVERKPQHETILPMTWLGQTRFLYFSGGAYFKIPAADQDLVEVIATYSSHAPGVIRFHEGLGTVVLSGVHPEAPTLWKSDIGADPDGQDDVLFLDLITSAL